MFIDMQFESTCVSAWCIELGHVLTQVDLISIQGCLSSIFALDKYNKWAMACDFQQCGILTSVDSDESVKPPVKLRNSKWCSISSLTVIEYSSDKQRLWSDCVYAQSDLRFCWSHIPHCWKSHAHWLKFLLCQFIREQIVCLYVLD